jgi:hypothetical protein
VTQQKTSRDGSWGVGKSKSLVLTHPFMEKTGAVVWWVAISEDKWLDGDGSSVLAQARG